MDNWREALGLGFELSSFILCSYLFHEPISLKLNFDANLTLAFLLGLSLIVWTIHAFIYFEKSK